MTERDDSADPQSAESDVPVTGTEGQSEEFSGVVIPTAEGRRYGSPEIDLLEKVVRDQGLATRNRSLMRISKGDLSDGEKFFLEDTPDLDLDALV